MANRHDPARISFTAHYTGYVWARNGLGVPELATPLGRFLYTSLAPLMTVSRHAFGGLTLETVLLQRHRVLDYLLDQAIRTRGVRQVMEVASGLSPRGVRLLGRNPGDDFRVLEVDLPAMAAYKARLLAHHGLGDARLQVVAGNALAESGDTSLAALAARHLAPDQPTAVVTEGLVNYFPTTQASAIWRNIRAALGETAGGVYLSDLHLGDALAGLAPVRLFKRLLEIAVRGKTYLHFDDVAAGQQALADAGFARANIHDPHAFRGCLPELPVVAHRGVVRVLEAWTA